MKTVFGGIALGGRRKKQRRENYHQPQTVKSRTHRSKRKSRARGNYKVLTAVVFVLLLIYILGYIIAYVSRPSVPTETVNYGTIDSPNTISGVIVRDEMVVKSTASGEAIYNYAENTKAPKNALVCTVKDTGTSDTIENEIKKIDKDILTAQESRMDISKNKDEIDRIENNLTNTVDNSVYKFTESSMTDMYSFKNNIQNYIDMRNSILINEITNSTSELTEQRKEYEKELSGSVSSYNADESGIISLMIDGHEEEFTPENINSITKEQIKTEIIPEYVSKSVSVKEGEPLFKIVKNNKWYVAAYVPNETAANYEVGDSLEIYTFYDEEELSSDMTVESETMGEKETFMVLSSDENLIDFLPLRTITFNIRQDSSTGLKIPNTAIVEKTFLKIPSSCVVDNLGEKTVILKNGSNAQTVKINVFTADDENVYVLQDYKTLKLGDVLVMGSGETAKDFTISEVENYKCVYVANSSMASYAVVNVIGQNSEYSIVKPSSSSYGLKVYDKIVSDAKSVTDDEALN